MSDRHGRGQSGSKSDQDCFRKLRANSSSSTEEIDAIDEVDLQMVLDGDLSFDDEHRPHDAGAELKVESFRHQPTSAAGESGLQLSDYPSVADASSTVYANQKEPREPPAKPKRPPSAYNLFFQLERVRVLEPTYAGEPSSFTIDDVARIAQSNNLPKPKRQHRKSHGKIGFADLARKIAQHWKQLDEDQKFLFTERALIERTRYAREMVTWKRSTVEHEYRQSQEQGQTHQAAQINVLPAAGQGDFRLDKKPAASTDSLSTPEEHHAVITYAQKPLHETLGTRAVFHEVDGSHNRPHLSYHEPHTGAFDRKPAPRQNVVSSSKSESSKMYESHVHDSWKVTEKIDYLSHYSASHPRDSAPEGMGNAASHVNLQEFMDIKNKILHSKDSAELHPSIDASMHQPGPCDISELNHSNQQSSANSHPQDTLGPRSVSTKKKPPP